MKPASNRQLTLLRKLNRKKYREKEQLFFVEGERAVRQVLENGNVKVESLFFDRDRESWLESAWKEGGPTGFLMEPEDFTAVADTDSPQGVLALCKIPSESDPKDLSALSGLLVATDALQNPGNLGTILRTAAWFGAGGVLSGKGTVDLFHPKVVRSTAGATGVLPWMNADLQRHLPEFRESGWTVWLLDAPGESTVFLTDAKATGKDLIVVGNEANGIRRELAGCGQVLSIPSAGELKQVESLNAAVAMSIALYRFTS